MLCKTNILEGRNKSISKKAVVNDNGIIVSIIASKDGQLGHTLSVCNPDIRLECCDIL